MGTSKAGRWIVAAALVAGAVAAFLLLMRADVEPGTATASETRQRAESAASDVPVAGVAAAAPKREAPRRVAPSSASSKTDDVRHGTVVVRVTAAEDDKPIAGASVFVGTIAGKTDAAGTARFEHLEACEWSFEASAPGRITRSIRRTIPADAESTVELRLVAAAALTVRVEDRANGAPIEDAKIDVDVVGSDTKDMGTTGDDGERLMSAPAGSILRVTATAYGYEEAVTSVRLGGGGTTTPVVLRLMRPGRMTGVVRAPDGSVVAKASIRLAREPLVLPADGWQWTSPASGQSELLSASDSDGRFVLSGLVHGRRYVAVAVPGDETWAASETVTGIVARADGPDLVQDFTLREFGRVVVRLTDASGAPVSDANVMVTMGGGIATVRSTRDEAGVYRLPPRSPGPVGISIWSPRGFAVRRVIVQAGATAEVNVVLGTADTVRCVVVDDLGRPVPGAKIESQATIHTVAFKSDLTTDASGAAQLQRFEGCTRRLTVTAPGLLTAKVESDGGSPDDVRVVMQRAAVLTFRVVGADGAPRAENARVLLGDDSQWERVTSAADGLVRLDCAPRGDVDVRLIFDTGAPVVRLATLAAGATADLGDLRLVEPRRASGRVVDAAGRPVEGAFVGMDSGKDAKGSLGTPNYGSFADDLSLSEADGSFTVDFAPPTGPLLLEVTADGFLDLHTIVDVKGDAPITLTLQRGGLVWGEVLESTGAPLGGATVRVIDARGMEVAAPRAGPHGEFDVRVAPGRYTVRADGCGDVSVELREGADEHVALTGRTR